MSSSITEYIKDCTILHKQKEDEVTWSKIDRIFTKLNEDLKTVDECTLFMTKCSDLLVRSILSERSKLSGTSLGLLRTLFDISKGKFSNLNILINAVLKICGRSNKIVCIRGHDTLVHICQYIDIGPFIKIFSEYYESTNKNIRLAVIKGILASKENVKCEKIIEKGKNDQFIEIRNLCKSWNKKNNVEKDNKINENIINKDKKMVENILKKNIEISKVPDLIKHSPFKKIPKIEKNYENKLEENACNKILELEKQVKSINSYKGVIKKDKPLIKFIKEKKDIQDDLTPKKLDKYLSKYRNIYGNILEENNKEKVENVNKEYETEDLIKEYEEVGEHLSNLSLVEDSQADLKYEYTIMKSEKEDEENNMEDEEKNIKEEEEKNLKDSEEKNIKEEKKNIKEEEEKNIKEEEKNDENNIMKEVNIVEKEENNIDKVKENNIDKNKENNIEKENNFKKDEEENIKIIEDYQKISNNKEKLSPSVNQNRFASLLFADKEECVIYDINADSPLFNPSLKETSSKESSLKHSTSPKSVINTAVSSSFLYSKGKEDSVDNSMVVDYTKIDSVVYVDKNIFKTTKD